MLLIQVMTIGQWRADEALNKDNNDLSDAEQKAALECKAKLKAQLKLLPKYIISVTRRTCALRLRCLIKLCFLVLRCNLSCDCCRCILWSVDCRFMYLTTIVV